MADIVVDPGHGGSAAVGGSSWNNAVGPNGTLEKTLTLDVGERVRKVLSGRGHNLVMTRDKDENLGLSARARVAKKIRAPVFVSIHFNGSDNHNAQGTETLVHTNYSKASATLSLAVQDAVLLVTGLTDRNKTFDGSTRIKPQSLGVLNPVSHDARTAGCLLEVSFLDRADEETRLSDSKYRDRIATGISDGIEAYLRDAAIIPESVEDAIAAAALEKYTPVVDFLGLMGAGVVASPTAPGNDVDEVAKIPSGAFSASFVHGAMDANALMPAAPAEDDSYLADFTKFVAKLNLEFFAADELLEMGGQNQSGKCAGLNSLPPRSLWKNIAATAQMVDEIRRRIGAPIRILSAYRSPAYNSCVDGEKGSLHLKFNAIDFTCGAGTPEIWRRIAREVRKSDNKFAGGIGMYVTRRFLHVDTRGSAIDWEKP